MLIKKRSLHMSDEVISYLNTYPAFMETDGERINDDFYDQYVSDVMTEANVDHDRNRVVAVDPENQPVADYCSAIWSMPGYMMNMKEAEALLRWMEPRWCKFKGIDSSGFFQDDLVILTEDEDFVV